MKNMKSNVGSFATAKLQAKMRSILAIALAAIFTLSAISCFGQSGGGKSLNSAEELKAYLDSQPANSPDKPIKIAMKLNETMLEKVVAVINKAGKYVSLDLTGNLITTIPEEAFAECRILTSVTIPNSVTSIGEAAFAECTSLTSVTLGNGVKEIGVGAFALTSLATVNIPNNVTSIGEAAFSDTSLTTVNIPNNVTRIGEGAFSDTSLTSVTLGKSVKNIGEGAFKDLENLTSVTFQGTIPSSGIDEDSFDGDLVDKYLKGGVGTYTRAKGGEVWTKK